MHGVTVPPWLAGSFALGELMTYPLYRLFASAACIVLAVGLYCVVNRTRLGMMIRAGASNRDMVRGAGHRHPPALPHRVRRPAWRWRRWPA